VLHQVRRDGVRLVPLPVVAHPAAGKVRRGHGTGTKKETGKPEVVAHQLRTTQVSEYEYASSSPPYPSVILRIFQHPALHSRRHQALAHGVADQLLLVPNAVQSSRRTCSVRNGRVSGDLPSQALAPTEQVPERNTTVRRPEGQLVAGGGKSIPNIRAICCTTDLACLSPFAWSLATQLWANSFGRREPASFFLRGSSPSARCFGELRPWRYPRGIVSFDSACRP
jgi:hypothetical protein